MPTLPSRLRILEYLRRNQVASTTELSRTLEMTSANIRHHLAILEDNLLIEVIGLERTGFKGRPVNVYGLSRRLLGDGFDQLSDAVLTEMLSGISAGGKTAFIRALARRLFEADQGSVDPTSTLHKRLSAALRSLNVRHYQSRWEASPQGPRLILAHCPYQSIVGNHPELCQVDAELISLLLDNPVEQTAKLEPTRRGLTYCSFLVK